MFRADERNQGFEFFMYDEMNRLTGSEMVNTYGRGVGYRVSSFSPTGNINEKSNVGLFKYTNAERPYQLTEVISENRPAQFGGDQTVFYTSFQRPSMINQGDYTTFFTYNASGDRVRMQTEHIKGGELRDRFYIGSRYEIDVIENSAILWLGGDAYSAPAALKRQFGGTWKIYYICRDYLGSIHVVTDEHGEIVQEISFDPWGRLRNAQTHQLYEIGNEPRLFLGNRGFTGHEHLPQFGLINMNARLYDPLVGRFLSPDPFVQSPTKTQNFNRYSYVLNNPLKYTDPTGERYVYCWTSRRYFDRWGNEADWNDVHDFMRGTNRGSIWTWNNDFGSWDFHFGGRGGLGHGDWGFGWSFGGVGSGGFDTRQIHTSRGLYAPMSLSWSREFNSWMFSDVTTIGSSFTVSEWRSHWGDNWSAHLEHQSRLNARNSWSAWGSRIDNVATMLGFGATALELNTIGSIANVASWVGRGTFWVNASFSGYVGGRAFLAGDYAMAVKSGIDFGMGWAMAKFPFGTFVGGAYFMITAPGLDGVTPNTNMMPNLTMMPDNTRVVQPPINQFVW